MVAELILLLTKHYISCWSDCIEIARNKIITKPDRGFTWQTVGERPPFNMLCDVISYVVRRTALACKQCGASHGMTGIYKVSCFVVIERPAQWERVRRLCVE